MGKLPSRMGFREILGTDKVCWVERDDILERIEDVEIGLRVKAELGVYDLNFDIRSQLVTNFHALYRNTQQMNYS